MNAKELISKVTIDGSVEFSTYDSQTEKMITRKVNIINGKIVQYKGKDEITIQRIVADLVELDTLTPIRKGD